jgi:hypothetical protein
MIKKINKTDLYLREIFYVLNGAVLVFILMEIVKPKIILAYFNLNYLLIAWIFLAIVVVIRNKK